MNNILKKLTFMLTITLCTQAPLQAFWGWGNAQSTTDAKSSWTTWILGGAAAIGAIGYLCYKLRQTNNSTMSEAGVNKNSKSQHHNIEPLPIAPAQAPLVNLQLTNIQHIPSPSTLTIEQPQRVQITQEDSFKKMMQSTYWAGPQLDWVKQKPNTINEQNVNCLNQCGESALHVAAAARRFDIVTTLIQKKANVNLKSNFEHSRTPLHCLTANHMRLTHSRKNIIPIARTLLQAKAHVHARTAYRETALHFAAWQKDSGLIQVLLDAGASLNVKDRNGNTPVDWAKDATKLALQKAQKKIREVIKQENRRFKYRFKYRGLS